MSPGTLLGVSLVVVGAAVWSLGAISLARANAGERVPRRGNEWWGLYQATYIIGFPCAVLGGLQLRHEFGWWTYVAATVAAATPPLIINAVHNRGLPRRTSAR